MKISSFFKFVEIQTKIASIIPFIIGILFAYEHYATFNPILLGIFLFSLLCVDMATTGINNYIDYKRAKRTEGYNYEVHNAIVRDGIEDSKAVVVIFALLLLGAFSGLVLYLLTDWVILFFITIFYKTILKVKLIVKLYNKS